MNTKNIDVQEGGVSKYVQAPCAVIADIVLLEFIEANSGTPGIRMIIQTEPVEGVQKHDFGTGQIVESKWWISEKAQAYTLERLAAIADKLGFRDQLDAVEGEGEEYVNLIKPLFEGKTAAWAVNGEAIYLEDKDEDGTPTGEYNRWVKPVLPLRGFVRSVEEIADLVGRVSKFKVQDEGNPNGEAAESGQKKPMTW